MKRRLNAAIVAGMFLLGSASPGFSQSVQVLGDFRDWSAYSANDGSGVICFATSLPKSVEPTPEGYGEARIYLTIRTAQGIKNEFNLIAGYEFAPDSVATATIGGKEYRLFTQLDSAWLEDEGEAESFAAHLRSGATLSIEGTSSLGVKIVQTFSLSGATASSRSINSAC